VGRFRLGALFAGAIRLRAALFLPHVRELCTLHVAAKHSQLIHMASRGRKPRAWRRHSVKMQRSQIRGHRNQNFPGRGVNRWWIRYGLATWQTDRLNGSSADLLTSVFTDPLADRVKIQISVLQMVIVISTFRSSTFRVGKMGGGSKPPTPPDRPVSVLAGHSALKTVGGRDSQVSQARWPTEQRIRV